LFLVVGGEEDRQLGNVRSVHLLSVSQSRLKC
jgi:hypothetical protein